MGLMKKIKRLVDVVNSNNASSEPKVSIADIHYEILGTKMYNIF